MANSSLTPIDVSRAFRLALENARSIAEGIEALSSVTGKIEKEQPFLSPFKLKLIESKRLTFYGFYQLGRRLSKHAIELTHIDYSAYLWLDSGQWCLDNDYWGTKSVSEQLSQIDAIYIWPKNVRELHRILVAGLWELSNLPLPTFGVAEPSDMREVLTWDNRYVLCGTTLSNMEIVTRQKWEMLCQREEHWFE